MSDGSVWVLIPLLGMSIPIVAILSSPIKRWIELQERKAEIAASVAGEQAAQYAAKIERLEARVAVLNRIVTDKGTDLAAEIDALPQAPVVPPKSPSLNS